MRYPAAEKLEIIRLVEQSALPVRRTPDKIGIPPAELLSPREPGGHPRHHRRPTVRVTSPM